MKKKHRDSSLSRKYIISIALTFSLLIVVTAVLFNIATGSTTGIMRTTLNNGNRDILTGRVENVMEYLKTGRTKSDKELKNNLSYYCSEDRGYLYVIIYSLTPDENFFKIVNTIKIKDSLNFNLEKGKILREDKDINYLNKAKISPVIDPGIYTSDNIYWYNVYHSYQIKKKMHIIQFMISAYKTEHLLADYNSSLTWIRWIMIIASTILIITVVVLTLIFNNNYTLLIKNLSNYMNKAAKGEYDINIKTAGDDELNELALSFNSLVDELKDRSGPEPAGEIFRKGVSLLKENNYEDCVSIFRTITLIKPDGHGSYFNLGVAYARMKDYDRSLGMFRKALEIKPDYEITKRYIEKVGKILSIHAGKE